MASVFEPDDLNSRSITISLPSEIEDMIIDHLHSDMATLRDCTLVSKHWLDSARYHLFHTIHLHYVPWRTVKTDLSVRNIESFLASAKSVWRYIQELYVHLASPKGETLNISSLDLERGYEGPQLDNPIPSFNILYSILTNLPKLHSLHFDDVTWFPPEFFGSNPEDMPYEKKIPLRTLTLSDITWNPRLPHNRLFWLHLNGFSSIQTLRLLNCDDAFGQPGGWQVPGSDFPHTIDAVVLRSQGPRTLLAMARYIPVESLRSLTSLDFRTPDTTVSPEGVGEMSRFLQSVGPRLIDLRVDYSSLVLTSSQDEALLGNHLDLSPCTSLQSFRVCLYSGTIYSSSTLANQRHWFTFSQFLSQLSQHTLTKITIELLHLHHRPDDRFNPSFTFPDSTDHIISWAELDETLSSSNLKLARVDIVKNVKIYDFMSTRPVHEDIGPLSLEDQETIRGLFPLLSASGRLHFLPAPWIA